MSRRQRDCVLRESACAAENALLAAGGSRATKRPGTVPQQRAKARERPSGARPRRNAGAQLAPSRRSVFVTRVRHGAPAGTHRRSARVPPRPAAQAGANRRP